MRAAVATSTPARRLSGLEAARGFAALAVVLYHAARHLDAALGAPLLRALFQAGHAGVDLFFVISGFIILYIHHSDIGHPGMLGHYAGRRLTRLMPTYWVALAATLLLQAAGAHPLPSPGTLLQNLWLVPSDRDPLLGVAWTLRLEIVFYVLFTALILHRMLGLAVLGAWLLTILAAQAVTAQAIPASAVSLYNIEFFIGMSVAVVLRRRQIGRPGLVLGLATAAFAASALLESLRLLDGDGALARLLYGGAAAFIVAGLVGCEHGPGLHLPAFLVSLGSASFSIYLFQLLLIGAAWQALLALSLVPVLPVTVLFGLLATSAVAGGLLASRLLEQPLIRLTRWKLSSRAVAISTPAVTGSPRSFQGAATAGGLAARSGRPWPPGQPRERM